MRILVLSDLHFEFHNDFGDSFLNKTMWPDHDIAIIAGDLCSSNRLFEALHKCSKIFTKIIYVPGNHDFFGSSIDCMKYQFELNNIKNIHILDNDIITIDDQRFIGGTMWYTINSNIKSCFIDFYSILDSENIIRENNTFLDLLITSKIENNDIIITHHLPSSASIANQYIGDPMNQYFLCNVENIISKFQPKLWVHGHTHTYFDYNIKKTRVVCNPLGYPNENNKFFPKLLTI